MTRVSPTAISASATSRSSAARFRWAIEGIRLANAASTDEALRNAVEAVTVSAVAFAIRAVTDPTVPANGGAMRPVRVLAPAGSVVAAVSPVAVGAGNVEVSQRVADVCLGIEAAARRLKMDFIPLFREDYYLLAKLETLEREDIQNIVAVLRTESFRTIAATFPGYDASDSGAILPLEDVMRGAES